jgi:hypothetical protein
MSSLFESAKAKASVRVFGRRFYQSQGCSERDGKDAAVTKCLFQVGSSLDEATAHANGSCVESGAAI